MNKVRRKAISLIIENLEAQKNAIEVVLDEEQEYFDNMPESFQDSERGDIAQEAIDSLESAIGSLEETIDYLNDIM